MDDAEDADPAVDVVAAVLAVTADTVDCPRRLVTVTVLGGASFFRISLWLGLFLLFATCALEAKTPDTISLMLRPMFDVK